MRNPCLRTASLSDLALTADGRARLKTIWWRYTRINDTPMKQMREDSPFQALTELYLAEAKRRGETKWIPGWKRCGYDRLLGTSRGTPEGRTRLSRVKGQIERACRAIRAQQEVYRYASVFGSQE